MANPFDQFDAASDANPFDQFDAQKKGRFGQSVDNARQAAAQEAPERGGWWDAAGQGATLGFADELTAGIGATIGTFDPALSGTTWRERYTGMRDIARENLGQYREREPATALAAEVAGGLLTGGAGAARSAGTTATRNVAGSIGRSALAGAKTGGTYGLGASEAEDLAGMAEDTAKGAALGGAIGGGVGGLVHGARGAMRAAAGVDDSARYQAAARRLDREGVPLTTGDRLGSQRLKAFEDSVGDSMLGPSLSGHYARQRQALQSQLMTKAGFPERAAQTGLIHEGTIGAAKTSFNQRYESLLGGVEVQLDTKPFMAKLSHISGKYGKKRGGDQIKQEIDELMDAAGSGPLDGRLYQELRSDLSAMSKTTPMMKPADRRIASGYAELKNAVDDAYAAGLPSRVGQAKRQLDREYSRFASLKKTFERLGGSEVEAGILPLNTLNREAKKTNDTQWRRLISSAAQVLPSRAPETGSSAVNRSLAMTAGIGASGAMGGVPGAAAAIGAPLAAQFALSRGIGGGLARPQTANAARRMLRTTGGLSGLGGVAQANYE